ncbi:hypothetical protein JXA88_03460 [Candidatus Fermentibacteria bacterium]|nr:hypothetical protein [Candidatus Fermentibacteria bacterium]
MRRAGAAQLSTMAQGFPSKEAQWRHARDPTVSHPVSPGWTMSALILNERTKGFTQEES